MAIENKGGNKGIANLKPCKKGEVRNPGGRPKIPEDIKKAFKELTPQALDVLTEIVNNPKSRDSDRLRACECILDRGWGKPMQSVEVDSKNIPQVVFIGSNDIPD